MTGISLPSANEDGGTEVETVGMVRRTTRARYVVPALLAAWSALSLGTVAIAEQAATVATPNVDPKAVEMVRAMSATLAAAKAFSVHAEIVYDEVMHSGRKLQFAAAVDAVGRRPDGLAVEYLSDLGGKKLWYDGKAFTLLDLLKDVYVTGPAPPNTSAFLASVEEKQGISFPLADFLADDPAARLLGDVRSAFIVGPGDVDGTTCHHLAFSNDVLDWQIWIDAGDKPLSCKIVITYRQRQSSPQFAAVFSEWEFPRSISDKRFVPDLPDDAHQVDFVAARNAPEDKP